MEDWQMVGVGAGGRLETVSQVTREWVGAAREAGFATRVADVGHPVLVEVMVLSVEEARRVNAKFLEGAQAKLRQVDAEKGWRYENLRHLDANAVSLGQRVEALLDTVQGGLYYTSWVIVESMDID